MGLFTRTARPTTDDRQEATIAAIRSHHGRIGRTVADHALTIQNAIDQLSFPTARRDRLVDYFTTEVLPHAEAEEATLYGAARRRAELRPLIEAMGAEHELLHGLVDRLAAARTPAQVAGATAALDTLLQSHLGKENDILLPALAAAGTDLASLLEGMHEILGPEARENTEEGCGCGGCACGAAAGESAEEADASAPEPDELDVRPLAHTARHERIFAAFTELPADTAFVLVNDHDPRPLHDQFAAEHPGGFSWRYLESGPRAWRVRIGRL